MSPIRRFVLFIIGVSMMFAGAYMIYGLLYLGFGGKILIYAASASGVFFGGYIVWVDVISPLLFGEASD